MRVECRSCHRHEEWDGEVHRVLQPGGSRRPTEHPVLAAWRTLEAGRRGGRAVVAACPCGQPMLATEGASIPWELKTVQGKIVVAETIQGPTGEMNHAATEAMLVELYGPRFSFNPLLAVFQGTMMLSILAPMLLWVGAVTVVILVLSALAKQPGF